MKKNGALLGVLFFIGSSWAQNISTTNLSDSLLRSGAGLGMSGAYRAVGDGGNALLYNPGLLAQRKNSMVSDFDYAYHGETSSHMYGANVIDFQTSPSLAYGLSYLREAVSVGGIKGKINQVVLGVGIPLGSFLSIGVSGKGYWVNIDSPTITGPSGVDADVGILIRPIKMLSLGAVGYHLFRGSTIEEFPRSLGFAAALRFDPHLIVSADWVRNLNTPAVNKDNINFGARVRMADMIFVQGGYSFDRVANNDSYSAGIHLDSQKMGLAFTFSQRLTIKSETYAVTIGTKL